MSFIRIHPPVELLLFTSVAFGCSTPVTETCATDTGDTGVQVGTIEESCRCEEPSFEFGTGSNKFKSLDNGDKVTMVHGPQGGWHIWGSVRAINTRNVVKIQFTAVDVESQTTVVDVTNQVALATESECTGTYTGMYGFLDVESLAEGELDTPPELLCYHELELTMTMTDTGGRELVETKLVQAAPDQSDLDLCDP